MIPTAVQQTPDVGNSRWAAIFARLLVTEGSRYVDNPNDHGGPTKFGLSLRFLAQQGALSPALRRELDIEDDCQIDAADIAGMTVAQAEEVYFDDFWPLPSKLPPPLDAAVFDQTVNDGATPAMIMLQAALNDLPCPGASVCDEDGQFGPVTSTRLHMAIQIHGVSAVLAGYRAQAASRYRAIVARDPGQAKFLTGWLTRAAELGNV